MPSLVVIRQQTKEKRMGHSIYVVAKYPSLNKVNIPPAQGRGRLSESPQVFCDNSSIY